MKPAYYIKRCLSCGVNNLQEARFCKGCGVSGPFELISLFDIYGNIDLKEAAREGDLHAEYLWGLCLEFALNEIEAFEWFLKAANKGLTQAQTHVGYYFLKGKGAAQNIQVAAKWFKTAADKGDSRAAYYLGEISFHEKTGSPKYSEAIGYFKKAAEYGCAPAYKYLGRIFEEGLGVLPNTELAFDYYKKSADSGDAFGMIDLARHYGPGFDNNNRLDLRLALIWSYIASKSKNGSVVEVALSNISILEGNLNQLQIESAHREANKWIEDHSDILIDQNWDLKY